MINIQLPLTNIRTSENYLLMFEDGQGLTHYFSEDGYDGWSGPPCTDLETKHCLN